MQRSSYFLTNGRELNKSYFLFATSANKHLPKLAFIVGDLELLK